MRAASRRGIVRETTIPRKPKTASTVNVIAIREKLLHCSFCIAHRYALYLIANSIANQDEYGMK